MQHFASYPHIAKIAFFHIMICQKLTRPNYYCMIEKVGSYWKWGKNQSWKCENSMYFHMTITFFLFEVQTWPTYENYSIFHGDSKKQHRVTPKRNLRNKNNTLSQASLDWTNISSIKVVYTFTKLIQEHFRHHIYTENQQTKSISKFC